MEERAESDRKAEEASKRAVAESLDRLTVPIERLASAQAAAVELTNRKLAAEAEQAEAAARKQKAEAEIAELQLADMRRKASAAAADDAMAKY